MKHIDRRDALKCMAWAGTGVVWSLAGGIPRSAMIGSAEAADMSKGLHFVQISDTHVGFAKDANPDVVGTFREAVGLVNAVPNPPAFALHTGDVTHLSKPAEFDLAEQLFKELKVPAIHFTPGEHDVLDDDPGATFKARFVKNGKGAGWYSFDQGGVHFIALINVLYFGTTGLGQLGADQLEWLEDDLKSVSSSTPIVVFSHIPLWALYPSWGWGTSDSEQAFAYMKRFGSVTVLNGHIHQVIQKVEGNVTFYSALSTAYPQPKPGEASAPGPMKVPADRLKSVLGIRTVDLVSGKTPLAITDSPLMKG